MKFSINYKQQVIPYLDKVLFAALKRAVKYSGHKKEIQKRLKEILAEHED